MANNQDFDTLMNRVEAATEQLEINVGLLTETGEDLQEVVLETEGYRDESRGYAQDASESLLSAQEAVTQAQGAATQAQQSVADAEAIKQQTETIRDDFLQNNVGEAPKDGREYARKDGGWSVVTGGGGGGSGTVTSVNNVLPDENGNVEITIPEQVNADWEATEGASEILNKPTLFSGNYDDLEGLPTLFDGDYNSLSNQPTLFDGQYSSLSGTPTIPTKTSDLTNDSDYITDAPSMNKQYVRAKGFWEELTIPPPPAPKGRPLAGYERTYFKYYGSTQTHYPNFYNEPIPISMIEVATTTAANNWFSTSGTAASGNTMNHFLMAFATTESVQQSIPEGNYSFVSGDFKGSPNLLPSTISGSCVLATNSGIMRVRSNGAVGNNGATKEISFLVWRGNNKITGDFLGEFRLIHAPEKLGFTGKEPLLALYSAYPPSFVSHNGTHYPYPT